MKDNRFLSFNLENQAMTESLFFHWFSFVFCLTSEMIFDSFCLMTLPNSGLVGFINLQVGLLLKLGLWSLRVMKASFLEVQYILSSRSRLIAISLSTLVMLSPRVVSAFL